MHSSSFVSLKNLTLLVAPLLIATGATRARASAAWPAQPDENCAALIAAPDSGELLRLACGIGAMNAGSVTSAIETLRNVQRSVLPSSIEARATFAEALAHCKGMQTQPTSESERATYCAHQRAARAAILAVSWNDLDLGGTETEAEAAFASYESCATRQLATAGGDLCDPAELVASGSDRVQSTVDATISEQARRMLESVTSPYRALIQSKLDLATSFATNGKKDLERVERQLVLVRDETELLTRAVDQTAQHIDPLYLDYFDLAKNVEGKRQRVAELGSGFDGLLEVQRLSAMTASFEAKLAQHSAALPAMGEDPVARSTETKAKLVELCKLYFCQLKGWPKFASKISLTCLSHPIASLNPICRGEVDGRAILDVCKAAASQEVADRFFKEGLADEPGTPTANDCLKTF